MQIRSVSVVGGGAWGTALAQTLAHGGTSVELWAREPEVIDDINARHVNRTFLPGVELSPSIRATGDLGNVAHADAILAVVPAQHLRDVMAKLSKQIAPDTPV
ncbi:MAG: 2-dehydropantoate 2-reductase N-terminal domain-containing protein, partial [Hyphomicrobium sp.]